MKTADKHIPFHGFAPEDDLEKVNLRYVPLEIQNSYDFSEPHRHAYFELFFFKTGGGTHLIDFIEYNIADNSIHVVRPGQVHLLRREPGSHGVVLHFSSEIPFLLGKTSVGLLQERCSVFDFDIASFDLIHSLLAILQQELSLPVFPENIQVAYLNLLMMKVGQAVSGIIGLPEERPDFAAFCALAEQHYREGRLPSWYASGMFITEKKLNGVCKTATGSTVTHYLKERVLLEAKRLLSYSEGSVKEIGYYLGFEDPAYFTRFFRKNTGMTAVAFREKYR